MRSVIFPHLSHKQIILSRKKEQIVLSESDEISAKTPHLTVVCAKVWNLHTRSHYWLLYFCLRALALHTEYHVAEHNKEGEQRVMKRNNSKVYQSSEEKNVQTCGCECRKFCIMHSLQRAFNKERGDECWVLHIHTRLAVCRVICVRGSRMEVTAGGYLSHN